MKSNAFRVTRHILLLPVLTFVVGTVPARAFDFQWNVSGPADWNVATNWSPEGPPSGGLGDHAYVNNGGTAVISADIPDIQDIFVGVGLGTSGTLNQTGGNTFQGTESWMFIGMNGGTGVYSLSGGTQNKARLYIGRGDGGNGTLNMSGTGAVDNDQLIIGESGATGAASLSDDATVETSFITIGGFLGTGSISLSDDATIASLGRIEFENGSMSVTDNASVSTSGEFWVGRGAGRLATLDMDSGVVEADLWMAIGRDGSTGVVNLSGTATMRKLAAGTIFSDDSYIAVGSLGSGGSGTLNVQDNATVWSDTGMLLNETAGQPGIVNQSGGTVTLHDYTPAPFQPTFGQSLNMDPNGHGQGEYHLSGGLLSTETVLVGGGVFDMTGGVFSATNFLGSLMQNGGTTSPGASPGTMMVTGDYSLNSGDLFIELDGLAPGTEFDQLIVTGDVSLAGELTLAVGFSPSPGDMFTIIDNQGPNQVSGMFSQGSSFTADGYNFSINYGGGDGNDVVLTVAIPEPSTALLLIGIFGLLIRRPVVST